MAGQKAKRRSRKRRGAAGAPRAVPSERRQVRDERLAQNRVQSQRTQRRARRQLGSEGERPEGPFGAVPVSEIAILVGGIGATVGLLQGGGAALWVGLAICTLGVVEVTAREHFSGFRSHASLLAGLPAAIVGILVVVVLAPRQRGLLLLAVVPVYVVMFWLLRGRFRSARQARVAHRPAP